MKEIADCKKPDASGVEVEEVQEGDLDHLIGRFPGPDNTPYKGGTFEVFIEIPQNYPFSPLKMKFQTKVYHPNISSQTGAICLDILKDSWSPVYTLKTALLSLQSLLCSPEPSDPQDAEVAKIYNSDRKAFESTAKYWTDVYAKGTSTAAKVDEIQLNGLDKNQVETFISMGFERVKVIEAMKKLNYRGSNIRTIGEDGMINELLR